MTTVAGDGHEGYAGAGGPALKACLNNHVDLVFDG